jgi:hypothetical protein
MPLWAWIAVGLGVLFLVFVVITIRHYPDDNSF